MKSQQSEQMKGGGNAAPNASNKSHRKKSHQISAQKLSDKRSDQSNAYDRAAVNIPTSGPHPLIYEFAWRLLKELRAYAFPFVVMQVARIEDGPLHYGCGLCLAHWSLEDHQLEPQQWAIVGALGGEVARRAKIPIKWDASRPDVFYLEHWREIARHWDQVEGDHLERFMRLDTLATRSRWPKKKRSCIEQYVKDRGQTSVERFARLTPSPDLAPVKPSSFSQQKTQPTAPTSPSEAGQSRLMGNPVVQRGPVDPIGAGRANPRQSVATEAPATPEPPHSGGGAGAENSAPLYAYALSDTQPAPGFQIVPPRGPLGTLAIRATKTKKGL